MNLFSLGETVKLSAQLDDGVDNRYPRARVFRSGAQVATIDLTHIQSGLYEQDWTPPSDDQFEIVYQVYVDTNHTVEDAAYGLALETWKAIDLMTGPFVADILSGKLSDYSSVSGSLAEAITELEARLTVARAAALDQIPDIQVDAELCRKLLRNRLELTEGTSNNWTLYDDDNTTVLFRWNVLDKDGNGVRLPSYSPARRFPT